MIHYFPHCLARVLHLSQEACKRPRSWNTVLQISHPPGSIGLGTLLEPAQGEIPSRLHAVPHRRGPGQLGMDEAIRTRHCSDTPNAFFLELG